MGKRGPQPLGPKKVTASFKLNPGVHLAFQQVCASCVGPRSMGSVVEELMSGFVREVPLRNEVWVNSMGKRGPQPRGPKKVMASFKLNPGVHLAFQQVCASCVGPRSMGSVLEGLMSGFVREAKLRDEAVSSGVELPLATSERLHIARGVGASTLRMVLTILRER